MEIYLNSIQHQIDDKGETTSIQVGYRGMSGQSNLNSRVEIADGNLDDMTRTEIDDAGRQIMRGWLAEETGE